MGGGFPQGSVRGPRHLQEILELETEIRVYRKHGLAVLKAPLEGKPQPMVLIVRAVGKGEEDGVPGKGLAAGFRRDGMEFPRSREVQPPRRDGVPGTVALSYNFV